MRSFMIRLIGSVALTSAILSVTSASAAPILPVPPDVRVAAPILPVPPDVRTKAPILPVPPDVVASAPILPVPPDARG